MEGLFKTAIEAFLSQTGAIGAAVIIILLGSGWAIWYLWRRNNELQEKRVEELRKTLEAMSSSAASLAALTISVDARNAVLTELSKAIASLIHMSEANREHFTELGRRLEDGHKATAKSLHDLEIALAVRAPRQ